MFEWLLKVANAARDVFVPFYRKRNDGNKAESEPRMALDDTARIVAAVVAPTHESFVSLHFLAEGMLAARENQAHVESLDVILDSVV